MSSLPLARPEAAHLIDLEGESRARALVAVAESPTKRLACGVALALFSAPLPPSAAKERATGAVTGPPSDCLLRSSTRMPNAADAPRAAILILASVHMSRPAHRKLARQEQQHGEGWTGANAGGKTRAGQQGAGAPERESTWRSSRRLDRTGILDKRQVARRALLAAALPRRPVSHGVLCAPVRLQLR